MIRRIMLASVVAFTLTGSAFAADLPSQAPPPVYVPPAPIFTWTGVYVGGQVGYAWGTQKVNYGNGLGFFSHFAYNNDGVIGGAHIGYNLQFNQFVVGLEGSVDGSNLKKSVSIDPGVPIDYSSRAYIQGTVRGRLGYAWDRVLVYATGGVAIAGTSANLAVSFPFDTFDSASKTRVGWTVGGGLEYAITNNWSVRAEYRYSDYGHTTIFPANFDALLGGGASVFFNRRFIENQVQVGFSYKFDTAVPAPVVAKY